MLIQEIHRKIALFLVLLSYTPSMEPLRDRGWKEYYSLEREGEIEIIDREINKWWFTKDPPVEKILESGGALSFPHTYLSSSLSPIVRVITAILKKGYEKILYVHSGSCITCISSKCYGRWRRDLCFGYG